MSIFEFLFEEAKDERAAIFGLATIAGISNVAALMIVNSVTHAPETATPSSFLLFSSAVGVAILGTRTSARRMNALIENSVHRLKVRLVKKIENCEIERLERIDAPEILDRLTENAATISVSASAISQVLPSASMFICGIMYLMWLSPPAFAVLLPLQLISIHLYRSQNTTLRRILEDRSKVRIRFLETIFDVLRGAKEIRLNRARTRSIEGDFRQTSHTLGKASANANKLYDDNALFVATNLYVLLAALAFVLPKHVDLDGAHVAKLVATILFIWASAQALIEVYVTAVKSNDALANIQALEKRLDGARKIEADANVPDPWSGRPGSIEFTDVEYAYPHVGHDVPFHIGPLNLRIEPGEVVFIVGGNGSGKSTLLKLLTGLYSPTNGTLTVAEHLVSPANAGHHREMISVIFSEFHLFSRAYGLLDADPKAVQALLSEMHIDHKTAFHDGSFTHQKLSTGQKKRLAMVITLLEDRPVLVLDEWAADQDPEFRKHFYEEMIPAFKRKGKTVIAVSHDDRYFHVADRVITLEYGQIRSERRKEDPSEPAFTAAQAALG